MPGPACVGGVGARDERVAAHRSPSASIPRFGQGTEPAFTITGRHHQSCPLRSGRGCRGTGCIHSRRRWGGRARFERKGKIGAGGMVGDGAGRRDHQCTASTPRRVRLRFATVQARCRHAARHEIPLRRRPPRSSRVVNEAPSGAKVKDMMNDLSDRVAQGQRSAAREVPDRYRARLCRQRGATVGG